MPIKSIILGVERVITTMSTKKILYRLPDKGQISGVAAGVAEYFSLDVTLLRVILVLLAFMTGGGIVVAYIILAIILPTPDVAKQKTKDQFSEKQISDNVQKLSSELKTNNSVTKIRNILGLGLVLLGIWLLLAEFFPSILQFRWSYIWPIVLIIAGILVVTSSREDK